MCYKMIVKKVGYTHHYCMADRYNQHWNTQKIACNHYKSRLYQVSSTADTIRKLPSQAEFSSHNPISLIQRSTKIFEDKHNSKKKKNREKMTMTRKQSSKAGDPESSHDTTHSEPQKLPNKSKRGKGGKQSSSKLEEVVESPVQKHGSTSVDSVPKVGPVDTILEIKKEVQDMLGDDEIPSDVTGSLQYIHYFGEYLHLKEVFNLSPFKICYGSIELEVSAYQQVRATVLDEKFASYLDHLTYTGGFAALQEFTVVSLCKNENVQSPYSDDGSYNYVHKWLITKYNLGDLISIIIHLGADPRKCTDSELENDYKGLIDHLNTVWPQSLFIFKLFTLVQTDMKSIEMKIEKCLTHVDTEVESFVNKIARSEPGDRKNLTIRESILLPYEPEEAGEDTLADETLKLDQDENIVEMNQESKKEVTKKPKLNKPKKKEVPASKLSDRYNKKTMVNVTTKNDSGKKNSGADSSRSSLFKQPEQTDTMAPSYEPQVKRFTTAPRLHFKESVLKRIPEKNSREDEESDEEIDVDEDEDTEGEGPVQSEEEEADFDTKLFESDIIVQMHKAIKELIACVKSQGSEISYLKKEIIKLKATTKPQKQSSSSLVSSDIRAKSKSSAQPQKRAMFESLSGLSSPSKKSKHAMKEEEDDLENNISLMERVKAKLDEFTYYDSKNGVQYRELCKLVKGTEVYSLLIEPASRRQLSGEPFRMKILDLLSEELGVDPDLLAQPVKPSLSAKSISAPKFTNIFG